MNGRHLPSLLLASLLPLAAGAGPLEARRTVGDGLEIAVDGERGELVLLEQTVDGAAEQRPLPAGDRAVDAWCARTTAADLWLFAGDGEGHWTHWRLRRDGEGWRARAIRTLHTGPDSELCALSGDGRWLFVTEEHVGIWALGAGPEAPATRLLLEHHPAFEPETLVVEGDALHWSDEAGLRHEVDLARLPAPRRPLPTVRPRRESATVARFGDAADDPAVFSANGVHLVLGTDKQGALLLLDADGAEIDRLRTGRLNNVDLRMETADTAIVAATDRTHGALAVFRLHASPPRLEALTGETALALDDPYGLCLHEDAEGRLHAFANDTDGRIVHVRLRVDGTRVALEPLAAWQMASQTEGCVVDDARQLLWLGEEARGVWRFPVAARERSEGRLVIDAATTPLVPDVEGLARLRDEAGRELLLVSSQGDDSYGLFDVTGTEADWLGSFRIDADFAAGIDGASETDGLELHPSDLGGRYPGGVLVVQDGRNRMPEAPQNFKLLALDDVLEVLAQSRKASSRR